MSFLSLRSFLLAVISVLALTRPAQAVEVCADLFEPEYNGLLQNMGSRAEAIVRLKRILPANRGFQIVFSDTPEKVDVLQARYDLVNAAVELLLNGQKLISIRAVPVSKERVLTDETLITSEEGAKVFLVDNHLTFLNIQKFGNLVTTGHTTETVSAFEFDLHAVVATNGTYTLKGRLYQNTRSNSLYAPPRQSKEVRDFHVFVDAPLKAPAKKP